MEITAQSDPLATFETWLAEAKAHPHVREATAMTLATVGPNGELHGRVVLCKRWTAEDGLLFFTNYESRKGVDLAANSAAACVFYWDVLFKQVKVSGQVVKSSRQISEDYWQTRARESQISQHVSQQSREVTSRQELDRAWKQAETEFAGRPVPCPGHWGGYWLKPQRIEFWIGRPGRFHDRYEFEKAVTGWTFRRLYP